MPKFYPLIKRITTIISTGGLNFRSNVRPATKQTVIGNLRIALQKPATRVGFAAANLRIALQRPATRVTAFMASAVVKPLQKAATRVTFSPANLIAGQQRPATRQTLGPATLTAAKPRAGGNIVQLDINLSHLSHIITATNRAANTQNWTNPANAQGAPDGVFATWGNPLSILSTGTLNGAMVAQNNRPTNLQILEVYLRFYSKATGLPIVDDLLTGASLGFFINTSPVAGVDTVLVRHGINYDLSAAGEEFRIDDGDGSNFIDTTVPPGGTPITWANIALITPYIKGDAVVGVNPTISVDAVRLRVVARSLQAN